MVRLKKCLTGETVLEMDVLSAFRRCGHDLVEFFNSTGWALYVNLTPDSRPSAIGPLFAKGGRSLIND